MGKTGKKSQPGEGPRAGQTRSEAAKAPAAKAPAAKAAKAPAAKAPAAKAPAAKAPAAKAPAAKAPAAKPARKKAASAPLEKAPKLPSLEETTWSVREVVDPGTPVGAVACVLGRVMIGGEGIYRVVPGTWDVQYRRLPDGVGWPLSITMEPRPPFRLAVGPETGDVLIFTDTPNATSVTGHPFTDQRGSKRAVELAWTVHEGQSTLFARTEDGALYGMKTEGWAELRVPPVHAIASDEWGAFAALTVVEGQPKVYLSHDGGETWELRALGVEVEAEPDAPAALAVASDTVAVAIGDTGVLLSRGGGAPTTRLAGFERAYALAFQGAAPRARLYVGVQRRGEEPAAVWLADGDGGEIKVMDFLCEDQDPLDLGPLSWDSSRGALMVSSRAGLLALAPEAPPKKRPRRDAPLLQ